MIGSVQALILLIVPFLVSLVQLGLARSPKWSRVARPLAQSTFLFLLGQWWLQRASLVGDETQTFFSGFLPWLVLFHLAMTLFVESQDAQRAARLYGGLLLSATFLEGMCLSTELGFLFLFGEAVNLSLWSWLTTRNRRLTILRSLVSFGVIGLGLMLLTSSYDTGNLVTLREAVKTKQNSDESTNQSEELQTTLGQRTGALLLIFGVVWRLGCFPFASRVKSDASPDSAVRELVLSMSSLLLLSMVLPRLRGLESLSQMLLATFAIPTLIRETIQSGWCPTLRQRWRHWLSAAGALMLLMISLELFLLQHAEVTNLISLTGLNILRREFLSTMISAIVLLGLSREFEKDNESTTAIGLLWSTPLFALVFLLTIFNWVGFPGTIGFHARWGLLTALLEVAGSPFDAARGYAVMGAVVLSCLMVQTFLALLTLQTVIDFCPVERFERTGSVWKVSGYSMFFMSLILLLFSR